MIQEHVLRGGDTAWGRDANGRQRRVTSRPVNGIDGDVRLNKSLWALSQRMAELKQAAGHAHNAFKIDLAKRVIVATLKELTRPPGDKR